MKIVPNSKQTINTEDQIHVEGINIACPCYGEVYATVHFQKVRVDTETGRVIAGLALDPEVDGPQKISLNQEGIVALIGAEALEAIKTELHTLRTDAVPE